jgi:hypothetical protein
VASPGFTGEILHVNAVRMRVTGSGNLDLVLHSLDNINTQSLTAIVMAATTNIEPTILANFKEQRVQLRFSVDAINEYFVISRIVLFIRPYQSGYAQ